MSAKSANDQSVTDDQELAKVLAGNASQQQSDVNDALSGLQFEESPVPSQSTQSATSASSAPSTSSTTSPSITPSPSAAAAANSASSSTGASTASTSPASVSSGSATTQSSTVPSSPASSSAPSAATTPSASPGSTSTATSTSAVPSLADLGAIGAAVEGTSGSLDSIKKDALEELRPLVDKLNLPAEEKFDTLLLIIRSTDDQSLLSPAHDAAKAIQDESRRAQALLDVIKEIDYFSAGQGQS